MAVLFLQALFFVLGSPTTAIEAGSLYNAVFYEWRCGCNAVSLDGVKCSHVRWCAQHRYALRLLELERSYNAQ